MKFDFKKSVSSKVNLKFIFQAIIIWAIANISIGFLISQGSSESSAYIGIIYIALIAAGIYIALRRNHITLYASALLYSITIAAIFAIADYLFINLFIEGNTLNVYHQWYIASSYIVAVSIPLIPFSMKVCKSCKLKINFKRTVK